jgi:hypothetical protein
MRNWTKVFPQKFLVLIFQKSKVDCFLQSTPVCEFTWPPATDGGPPPSTPSYRRLPTDMRTQNEEHGRLNPYVCPMPRLLPRATAVLMRHIGHALGRFRAASPPADGFALRLST